jgi:hypothetical protein
MGCGQQLSEQPIGDQPHGFALHQGQARLRSQQAGEVARQGDERQAMGLGHSLEIDAADQAHLMTAALQFQQDRQVGLQVSPGPHGDHPDPGH